MTVLVGDTRDRDRHAICCVDRGILGQCDRWKNDTACQEDDALVSVGPLHVRYRNLCRGHRRWRDGSHCIRVSQV